MYKRSWSQGSIITTVVATILLAACNGNDTGLNGNAPVVSNPPPTSLPMPPVSGNSLNSMGWSLADGSHSAFGEFRGKVLILDFYATWCGPCRDSIPHLVDLQQRYQQEVAVIGLNVGGPADLDRVPAFAQRFSIQYPLGEPDEQLTAFLMRDSNAIPQTFVFDRSGQLTKRFIGYGQGTGAELDRAVESALQSSSE